MPELPELEIVRDVLQARLGGRIVERVTLSGRGGKVSEISAGGKITNFCRTCQPGGLIRGM